MTISIFPTLIHYAPLGTPKLNRELEKEAYQIRDYDKEGQKWCKKNYPGGYTSYQTLSSLHTFSSTFSELEKKIRRSVKSFVRKLQYDMSNKELFMTDCWVNIMPKKVTHPMHLHPLSTISGTYYVSTPKGTSSITFEDPRLPFYMAQPPRPFRYSVTPKAGNLVLFESWLRHEVEANQAEKDRISISFNYHWR